MIKYDATLVFIKVFINVNLYAGFSVTVTQESDAFRGEEQQEIANPICG